MPVRRSPILLVVFLFAAAALLELALGAQAPVPPGKAATPAPPRTATARLTTPKAEWGNNLGDDYFLANYQQLMAYWKKLDAGVAAHPPRGDRQDVGGPADADGDHHVAGQLRRSSRATRRSRSRLAHAEGLTDEQARALAQEGKAVVWIDGGLHATETLGAQQLLEQV